MKRSPGLRALSSEHHTALIVARRAALAAAATEIAEAWRSVVQFERALEHHFHQEEEQLLPALLQQGERALVERTLAEHAQLRTLLHAQPRDGATLHTFAELLQAHIRFEERKLFDVAQQRLPGFFLAAS